ncbi:MAG: hypothetical protein IPK76_07600 [Lewinellaceae bacterium]|jgi:hypothetical protein|nr:hypothetical protein [Lewinellaceae bacterium]
MKNKKIVATLLHACTLYCVSACNVQGYDLPGTALQSYAGQVAASCSGNEFASHVQRDEGVFNQLRRVKTDLSAAIRLLLKVRSERKESFVSPGHLFQYLPVPGIDSNFLLAKDCQRTPTGAQRLPRSACVALDACAEGNSTWMKYSLAKGP